MYRTVPNLAALLSRSTSGVSLVRGARTISSSSRCKVPQQQSLTPTYTFAVPRNHNLLFIPLTSTQSHTTTTHTKTTLYTPHKYTIHTSAIMSGKGSFNDGGMNKDGVFNVNNTIAPKYTDRVLPLFSLKGRTAIVSGAGAGIGLSVAHALAEAGANVAIWYNSNKKALDEAKAIEQNYGVKCKAYQVNVTSAEAVDKAVDEIVNEFGGRLDIFIANSGIPWTQGAMLDGEISHYEKVMKTDVDGTFFCARSAGRHWRRQKVEGTTTDGKKLEGFREGSFVATASMSGHIVNIPQLQAAYNAAKAGVIHLCKSLAVEWVGFARANTVSPGYINTEISAFVPDETKGIWKSKIPMGREGEAHELKGAFLYLASDAASYTTGADIVVDGGYCLP